MRLSVYSCCSNAIENQFTLVESILSANLFADEFIYVDGGSTDSTLGILDYIKDRIPMELKIYHNPWEDRMGTRMYSLQKTIALSHCTGDLCMLMDADEVLHEDMTSSLFGKLTTVDMGNIGWLNTIHFYGDYKHYTYKDPLRGYDWYKGKVYIIKNNQGCHHFCSDHDMDCLTNSENIPIMPHWPVKHNGPSMYHYGHVRSNSVYLRKKNSIEKSYHGDKWLELESWKWDTSKCEEFQGSHPLLMGYRIDCGIDEEKISKLYTPEYVNIMVDVSNKLREEISNGILER